MSPSFIRSGWVNDPDLGLVRWTAQEVSDDPDTQVAQTIELMRQYSYADASSPLIQQDVMTAAQGDPIEDTWRYLSRKDGIRQMQFVHDEITGRPWGDIGRWRPVVETLIRPCDQVVALRPKGDCDDFSMYGAAHLLARGVPVSFCTIAADDKDPSVYSHVYLVAYPNGRRVPMDLSHGWYAGWETVNKYGKRKEWPVTGTPVEMPINLCGLALLAAGAAALCVWKGKR